MKLQNVLDEKLNDIRVSEERRKELLSGADAVISRLEGLGFYAVIGGSLAKGTLIDKDVQDVDIFVVFDSEELLNERFYSTLEGAKFDSKLVRVHGSRDYFQLGGVSVMYELIPVVKVEGESCYVNVTDMSLSHVAFVRSYTQEDIDVVNGILLAKAFCRARGVYGAESYIRGFSGYSLELLVCYFGSFEKFLKGMIRLSVKKLEKRFIDIDSLYSSGHEAFVLMNSAKLQGPLLLVDPTCRSRNVTAGLGNDTFEKFIAFARDFLKKPSLDFFDDYVVDEQELGQYIERLGGRLLTVQLLTEKEKCDIAGTKCLKVFDFLVAELERQGQKVLVKDFVYLGSGPVATGYIGVREMREIEVRGPGVANERAVKSFIAEHSDAYKKGKYFWRKKQVSVDDVIAFINSRGKEMGAVVKDYTLSSN